MTAVQQIDRFVKELGTKHVLQVLGQILARWGLVLGGAVMLVHLLLDALLLPGLLAAGFLVAATLRGVWRHRLGLPELDRFLELRDGLTTWHSLRRRGPIESPMALWLADDLVARIEAIPEPRRQAAVERRVGGLRYLLPLLIVLLVIEIAALFEDPPPPPPPPPPPGIAGGGGRGGGGGGPGPASPSEAPPAGSETRQEKLPFEQQGPSPPPQGPPPEPEAANPLPDLELRDEFAVPHFVGEGETRRQLARQARVGEQLPTRSPTGGGGGAEAPEPSEVDFERAYERALQSRHVPEQERPFLRRYFRILREGGR